ncbi:MAG: CRISPR-associated DxTHG motif protein [Vulcanisaeta sp.]|uniref:CRISPR-associated DxTHG motif protein n=1 Tax=Vulcanisaeta sp. TaxID=2020871 RepID=UPI003D1175A7
MGTTLIIGCWGDPRYDAVKYEYGGHVIRSHTSIFAVAQSLAPNGDVKVLVLIPSTLYLHPSMYGDEEFTPGELSYAEFADKIRERVLNHLRNAWVDTEFDSKWLNKDDDTFVVAPATMKYRGSGNVYVDMQAPINLYGAYTYMTVLRKLRELGDISEVIMDITHGLNYMPTMMLRYASLAVYTYVITSSTEKLTVKIVDSEPYTPQLRDYDITLGIRDVSAENLGKAYSLCKALSMLSINTVGTLNEAVRKSGLVALDALHNGTHTTTATTHKRGTGLA